MTSSERLDDPGELVVLDRSTPVPLYYQVAQQLEAAIADGRLRPGTRIDNEVELANRLGLSRPTVRRAMETLVDKGIIVRRRGAGTRVVSSKVRRSLQLTSLYDDLAGSGQHPRTRLLAHDVVAAEDEVARALEVRRGAPVVAITRLRLAADRPIARMQNYLPRGLVELSDADLERRGLYALMRSRGVVLHSATQVIGARTATAAEARLLDERRNAAVLTMQRITRDDRGAIVEYGSHSYAASRYSFELGLLSG